METNEKKHGTEEGDNCNRIDGGGNACQGVLEYAPVENCSCHLSSPCGACVNNTTLICHECGWETGMPDVEKAPPPFDGLPTEADIKYNKMWCEQNNVEFNEQTYVEEYKAYHANKKQEVEPLTEGAVTMDRSLSTGSITYCGLFKREDFKSEKARALIAAHDLVSPGMLDKVFMQWHEALCSFKLSKRVNSQKLAHLPLCYTLMNRFSAIVIRWLFGLFEAEKVIALFNGGTSAVYLIDNDPSNGVWPDGLRTIEIHCFNPNEDDDSVWLVFIGRESN